MTKAQITALFQDEEQRQIALDYHAERMGINVVEGVPYQRAMELADAQVREFLEKVGE